MTVADQVVQALKALACIGIKATPAQLAYPLANAEEMIEYRQNGMKIDEIADMVREIVRR